MTDWRPIPGYSYEVSPDGLCRRVFKKVGPREIKPHRGLYRLRKGGAGISLSPADLVAIAFNDGSIEDILKRREKRLYSDTGREGKRRRIYQGMVKEYEEWYNRQKDG